MSAWGGYVFIINLIPLHVFVLLLMQRYSRRVYIGKSRARRHKQGRTGRFRCDAVLSRASKWTTMFSCVYCNVDAQGFKSQTADNRSHKTPTHPLALKRSLKRKMSLNRHRFPCKSERLSSFMHFFLANEKRLNIFADIF